MKFNKKEFSDIHFEGMNEVELERKNKKDILIQKRLFIVLGALFMLAIVLLVRLYYIQVTNHDLYIVKLEQYGVVEYTTDATRGTITDRNGVDLVVNENSLSAIYYGSSTSSAQTELIANFLIANCEVNVDSISTRESKDYFLIAYPDIVNALITEEQEVSLQLSDDYSSALYALQIGLITEELMEEYMDDETLMYTCIVYLIGATGSGTITLVENLSVEEASIIGANANLLKCVSVSSDWSRVKVMGSSFSGVLGTVTTSSQGLPIELANELLSLGLQNNSRVGVSGIEEEYDTLLRGIDSTYTISVDENGNYYKEEESEGVGGTSLQLTIDWELQTLADELLTDVLVSTTDNEFFTEAFFILMDADTGDVLVMSGKTIDRETGTVYDYADGNYKSAYLMGSTVKGGTIYTAYKNDLIYPGEEFYDTPIKIKDTAEKSSWTDMGWVDDVYALARSSNVYMFNIAIRLGGGSYSYNQSLVINTTAFDTLRASYAELGLGVKTGIDVPEEALGYRGSYSNRTSGLLLDFVIGQYDSYTPIQLAQYTATIANKGVKVSPRLVLSGFQTDSLGEAYTTYSNDVEVMDIIEDEDLAFERIWEGYSDCVTQTYGTCYSGWQTSDYDYDMYVKSGTAQVFDYSTGTGVDYSNLAATGWSAIDGEAEVVFAIVLPRKNSGSYTHLIAAEIMDAYFEKYVYDIE
ncbi:penicillin-binding transpeptidase domain-containing protein [Tannockella kyphosi]|uniref:penicillin-binding transpeptidase domain-containing protein n=1 Tax=Tannockella kyphosi TaxID=2899121 RepID=UPI0020124A4E|nr:penicillin-binding transpeptidase domain-containing protein [Tannockella kyphosi]